MDFLLNILRVIGLVEAIVDTCDSSNTDNDEWLIFNNKKIHEKTLQYIFFGFINK